jgi:predicted Zn-dependent peptidase
MKPKLKTLKNGMRIVTVPMKDNPTVTVMVMVEAGTRYETKETNGLSHFLEHMCFKGTQKRGNKQIAYELESMGAETNAFTSYDYTGYYAKGRFELFPKLLDVVSDVYLNSVFPEAELEKERGVICGEIDMYEDLPQRAVHDLFAQSLFGDQPAGYTILGPKENIKRFKREDFLKYYRQHYVAGKTLIVVAGNVDTRIVEKMVADQFKNIQQGAILAKKKINSKIQGLPIMIQNKKTDQSHLVIGMKSLPMEHPDRTALAVLIGLLGQGMSSRLFVKLREDMGAGYYVRAELGYLTDTDDISDLNIRTGTEPKRVAEVIKAIMHEIELFKNQSVSEKELNKIKEYLIGGMYMHLESSDAVAGHVAHFAIAHKDIKTPKEIEKAIRKISADDILRVAKKYLKKESLHLALIGPHENKVEIEKAM